MEGEEKHCDSTRQQLGGINPICCETLVLRNLSDYEVILAILVPHPVRIIAASFSAQLMAGWLDGVGWGREGLREGREEMEGKGLEREGYQASLLRGTPTPPPLLPH